MQNLGGRARVAVVSSMVVVWAFLAYACSVEDENPGSTRDRGVGADGGSTVDPQGTPDAQIGAPICGKYGGYDNVKTIAAGIVARVANDCRISAPIANLDANGTQHFAECFEIQIGGAFQCPGISYVANTTKDSKGQKCRDMSSAHKGLNLRSADFNAFVEDVAAELAAKGVTQDDIRAIAPVFEGTRTGVVQTNNQPDKNTFCTCADGQYMGKSCVVEAGIVDAGTDATDAADAADGD
jgi:hypothetical protein